MGKLSKDKRDVYYREAKRVGFRARSAYKLLQIDETTGILDGVRNVVDLCAAPGGWSQVLAARLGLGGDASVDEEGAEWKPQVVAVDLMPMEPIDGVVQVQGDITHEATATEVLRHFNGCQADAVICDGAPDVTGLHDFDEYIQHQLLLSALHLACMLLRRGGSFVAKIFRGEHVGQVYARLKELFEEVLCCKPKACRNSSIEAFVVCRGYAPPENFKPALYSPSLHEKLADLSSLAPVAVPFVACGGPDALDADRNYGVTEGHEILGTCCTTHCGSIFAGSRSKARTKVA